MRKSPLLFLLSTLTLLVDDSKAAACSGTGCGDIGLVGSMGPTIAMGTIPANTPGIGVGFDGPEEDLVEPGTLKLKETSGTMTRDVPLTWQPDQSAFLLSGPLTPGSTVELDTLLKGFSRGGRDEPQPACGYPMRGSWQVTEETALPTELGALSATYEQRTVNVAGDGPCVEEIEASTARVLVDHAASAEPWRDLLVYETWVDGERWRPSVSASSVPYFVPGGSNIAEARGEDLLAAECPNDIPTLGQRLKHGKHTVEIRAHVPGSTLTLTAGPIEIDLAPCGHPQSSSGHPESSKGCSAAPFAMSTGQSMGSLAWLLGAVFGYRRRRAPARTH